MTWTDISNVHSGILLSLHTWKLACIKYLWRLASKWAIEHQDSSSNKKDIRIYFYLSGDQGVVSRVAKGFQWYAPWNVYFYLFGDQWVVSYLYSGLVPRFYNYIFPQYVCLKSYMSISCDRLYIFGPIWRHWLIGMILYVQ
jgi:hypothetical protein